MSDWANVASSLGILMAYSETLTDPQSKVDIQNAGTGVYFITGATHNSIAEEFRNYMAVIDSPVGDSRAIPLFDAIKKRFPNKRIRYVINTHHHFDHAGGLRDAVAEGATILTDRDTRPTTSGFWQTAHDQSGSIAENCSV